MSKNSSLVPDPDGPNTGYRCIRAGRQAEEERKAITDLPLDLRQLGEVRFVGNDVGRLLRFDDEDVFFVVPRLMDDDIGVDPTCGQHALRVGKLDFFRINAVAVILRMDLMLFKERLKKSCQSRADRALGNIEAKDANVLLVKGGQGGGDDALDVFLLHQSGPGSRAC